MNININPSNQITIIFSQELEKLLPPRPKITVPELGEEAMEVELVPYDPEADSNDKRHREAYDQDSDDEGPGQSHVQCAHQ